jgi:hypothetical protein
VGGDEVAFQAGTAGAERLKEAQEGGGEHRSMRCGFGECRLQARAGLYPSVTGALLSRLPR